MSAFPLAHAAKDCNIHGVVAMGVRWRFGASYSNDQLTHDYIIECILPTDMRDINSQKHIAIKCCEALWQISSR